jgi:hypothetical protein
MKRDLGTPASEPGFVEPMKAQLSIRQFDTERLSIELYARILGVTADPERPAKDQKITTKSVPAPLLPTSYWEAWQVLGLRTCQLQESSCPTRDTRPLAFVARCYIRPFDNRLRHFLGVHALE